MLCYCEYYLCGFNLSVSVLLEYMCCVYVHGWGCVMIAGFHYMIFCLWMDKIFVLGRGHAYCI